VAERVSRPLAATLSPSGGGSAVVPGATAAVRPGDVSELEWALFRAARDWARDARAWLGPYLLVAALAFVPLAVNPALGRALEFQAQPFTPERAYIHLPALPLGPTLFDVAWIILALVVVAGIARAAAGIPASGARAAWRAVAAGVREGLPAMLPWVAALWVATAACIAALAPWRTAAAPAWAAVGAMVALALAAWLAAFWLVVLVAVTGRAGARPATLWRLVRARPWTVIGGGALWAIVVGLVGMLAAAATWTVDLWVGMAFYALALAAAWLVALRTAAALLVAHGAARRRAS
jgi:hypothetical protein